MMQGDARVPVMRGTVGSLRAGDAVLLPAGAAAPDGHAAAWIEGAGHPAGCACCPPRAATGQALGRLFLGRARGEVAFFSRVVAVVPEAQWEEVRRVVETDVLAKARFRVG